MSREQSERVKQFLAEVAALCRKYELQLVPWDGIHGNLEVWRLPAKGDPDHVLYAEDQHEKDFR